MPGNLLFTNTQIPNVTGNDTNKDMKNILNYLYMLREELRYTMSNIGVENFNETELSALSAMILGDGSIAEIQATADSQGASISLLTAYTGLATVVTVTDPADRTDITKTYKIGTNYYRWNGTAWVEDASVTSAALTLAAINGQSTASLKADRIDLTGNVTIASQAGLAAGTIEINGGCLNADTVATDALKVRTESNLDWLDFYAGIDMTVIDVEDTTYYPDTRQVKGIKKIRLYNDDGLVSGHGATGNDLIEVGGLYADDTGFGGLIESCTNGTLLFNGTNTNSGLGLKSGRSVVITAGDAAGIGGNIELVSKNTTTKTDGYGILISSSGITVYKKVGATITTLDSWT